LTPGVVNDSNGFGLLSFRGISTLLNNTTVDGADNNQAYFSEERGRTRASYSTSQAAIQEFQVNGSNYSAEFGRAAGGVINTVTKSGSNNLHGQLFFYDRDNTWGATNPFTTITNPNTLVTSAYKPTDWRKQWGFGVGGKLIKDKLFWFYSYDQQKKNFPGTARVGDPSAFFAAPAAALPAGTTCNGVTAVTTASAATLNTAFLCAKLGVPYATAVTMYNGGLNSLATLLGPVPRKGDQVINFPKLDWTISQKHHASFQYNRLRWDSPAGIQTQASNQFGRASFGNDFVKEDWGIARLSSFLTNNISNEVRYQYGRDFEFENSQAPTAFEGPLSNNLFNRPAEVKLAGGSSGTGIQFGTSDFLERGALPDERRNQAADTVTWVHGKHVTKFGADYNHVYDFISNLFNEHGTYTYSSNFIPTGFSSGANKLPSGGNGIGTYLTDYLHLTQGLPFAAAYNTPTSGANGSYNTFTQAIGPRVFNFTTNDWAFFGTDDWKIVPRLTLTLGLRWEYQSLPNPFFPNDLVPQTASRPHDYNNFGPRVGFAWDMFGSGRTVLRGGYGIFYGRIVNGSLLSALSTSGGPGGVSSFSFSSTAAGAPAYPVIPASLATTTCTTSCPSILFLDQHLQNPQIHQTDLILEHNLGWNTVVSASYLGSYGRELINFLDTHFNANSVTSLTYGVVGGGPLPGNTYTTKFFTGARPVIQGCTATNPCFSSISDVISNTNSSYNALVLQANHRMSHGLQFAANYTWSHALDFNQAVTTGTFTTNTLDPTDPAADYGNSNFNVPQRFVLSTIYQPQYKAAGWLGYLVNDFTMSPIIQIQNGLPYTAGVSGSPSGVSPAGALSGINGSGGDSRFTTIGRNTFRRPNTYVVDYRMSKRFALTERYRLEFLGEAFNLFNHQNVTAVNTTAYTLSGTTLTFNPAFGATTNANSNTAYRERQIQLAVRFEF
jgi:hypothetical protein